VTGVSSLTIKLDIFSLLKIFTNALQVLNDISWFSNQRQLTKSARHIYRAKMEAI